VDEVFAPEDRQAADQLRDEMLSKHDEVSEGLGTALSYQLSENLIGIRSRAGGPGQPLTQSRGDQDVIGP
jgi:hypothetical protein